MTNDPETGTSDLVQAHQRAVWRYLRFLGCDPAEADDLTQETFVRALGRPPGAVEPEAWRGYLRAVARNAFLKAAERGRRRREVDLELAEAAFAWAEGEDEGERTRAALDACLDELPRPARAALDLRFRERLDRSALAARLGLGENGAKSLLQRTYARLRVCIERRLRDV
jgi:RNA polymerase sigma-70 factor (ECF subfamily)